MRLSIRILLCSSVATLCLFAQPVCTSWLRTPQTTNSNPALDRVRPEVHSVACNSDFVDVHSAGISLYPFGILANPVNPAPGVREVSVHIPRHPQPETAAHATVPTGTIGIFINGVPIEDHLYSDSFEGRNIWHYDLNSPIGVDPAHSGMTPMLAGLLNFPERHSPIIGFALDGYPIYGPWGFANAKGGALRQMRPGYRLRNITQRTTWPDGTQLTPGQYGPTIDKINPLGVFSEDYEYVEGSGDLDRFNGRFAVTPEFPEGTYAYFLAMDDKGQMAFPYLLAGQYYGHVEEPAPTPATLATRPGMTLKASAAQIQAGIPVTIGYVFSFSQLEYVHEKPIHLIVVSEDLSEFSHIHPERALGDRYTVVHTFAHGGHYRLYAEFTPPGEGPRLETFDVQVSGPPKPAVPLAVTAHTQQSPEGLQAELTTAASLRAGVDYTLSFRLNSNAGLQPYLGAWGHFVLIGNEHHDFIHAHPMQLGQPVREPSAPHTHSAIPTGTLPPETIDVPVAFPRAGLYKLWAQFQVNGEVQIVPFVLRVLADTRSTKPQAIPKNAIRLTVGPSGFTPARLEIPAGKATTIAVTRDAQPNCASKMVIPDAGITRDLPPGKTVLITLPAMQAKEMKFACGMGRYRGLLVIK